MRIKKVNPFSIKFRLLTSFAAVNLIILLLVFITIARLSGIMEQAHQIEAYRLPTRIYAHSLENAVSQSTVALQNFLLFKQESYKTSRENIWHTDIRIALDSLNAYARAWKTTASTEAYMQIVADLRKLQRLQKEAELLHEMQETVVTLDDSLSVASMPAINPAYSKFEDEILPVSAEINKSLNRLQDIQIVDTLEDEAEINRRTTSFKGFEWICLIVAIGVSVGIAFWLASKIQNSIRLVRHQVTELSKGNLPDSQPETRDELNVILQSLQSLIVNLRSIKEFAIQVGNGKYENDISIFNNQGTIGQSLVAMRESLKNVALDDKRRNWVNEGLALVSDILRKNASNTAELADDTLSSLIKYLNANQGGLFIVNDSGQQAYLELKACFAYNRKKYIEKRILSGQGLVGQCWQEGGTIYLKQIPNDYLQITSGLGDAPPRNLLILPLQFNNTICGVLELASFQTFEPYEIEFVEKISESIASAIVSVKTNENTKRLLEESQMLSEQMRAQEEEMRQNMEELAATQEEMLRKGSELEGLVDAITRSSATVEFSATGDIINVNDRFCELSQYNRSHLIGKPYSVYVPQEEIASGSFQQLWSQVAAAQHLEKTVRRLRKDGAYLWLRASYFPITDPRTGALQKITCIYSDITQDMQEKEALQKQLAGLKTI